MEIPALPAVHAGSCYPRRAADVHDFFARALDGVGGPQAGLTFENAEFLILPHIDFRVNLDLYAQAYRTLAGARAWPERILIMGVGHQCPHEFSIVPFPMATPIGTLAADFEAYEYIEDGCPFDIANSPESFVGEHSIEFAAIWLEAVRARHFPRARSRALPMLCGGLHDHLLRGEPPGLDDPVTMVGERLAEWIGDFGPEGLLVIVSIDGCHVGPRFGHLYPAHAPARRAVQSWESALWSLCSQTSYDAYFDHLSRIANVFHFDGVGALSTLIRHLPLRASIDRTALWHEEEDQSMVTFSCGRLSGI